MGRWKRLLSPELDRLLKRNPESESYNGKCDGCSTDQEDEAIVETITIALVVGGWRTRIWGTKVPIDRGQVEPN